MRLLDDFSTRQPLDHIFLETDYSACDKQSEDLLTIASVIDAYRASRRWCNNYRHEESICCPSGESVNKVHGRHRLAISKQPFWPNRVQLELEFSRLEECSTECRKSRWNVRHNFPDNTRPWLSFPQGLNTGDYQVAGGMPRVPAVFLTCYVVS